ncbi:MAG: Phosphatidylserine decarboxylase proenzyme [candidate division TM6 bacterium GW2011_GWF2_28_16]|nr:MAG: Phosphatidylserine decarboxylase proenzyme [candidate division TM6 bacterium GW2011_GWF2_28_16]
MLINKKILFFLILTLLFFIVFNMFKNKNNKVYYYNLENKLVCEKIEAEGFLNFLYFNKLGNLMRPIFIINFISKLMGAYQDSFISKYKIKSFIKKYNINTSEFLKNISEFSSFNDFFVRELSSGARLIDQNKNNIISPADSKFFIIPDISQDVAFFVKNKKFNLEKFLNDKVLAQKYQNGSLLIFRLAPPDYHRYHFSCDSIPEAPVKINGILESVNSLVYKSGVQPLTENERVLIKLNTQNFGDILFIPVGAMFVGKIINTFIPEKQYIKGQEMGYFKFGGSTIVMLFEKDKIKIQNKFLENSQNGFETQVKMGQILN